MEKCIKCKKDIHLLKDAVRIDITIELVPSDTSHDRQRFTGNDLFCCSACALTIEEMMEFLSLKKSY